MVHGQNQLTISSRKSYFYFFKFSTVTSQQNEASTIATTTTITSTKSANYQPINITTEFSLQKRAKTERLNIKVIEEK